MFFFVCVILGRAFSAYLITGLVGGGGGNSPREREIRQYVRTLCKCYPNRSATSIQYLLYHQEGVRRSVSAIRAQLRRDNTTTVARRSPYRLENVARDDAFLRLVVGVLPLGKDGTRTERHSINVAIDIVNSEEKASPLGNRQARRIIKSNGYYSAIRRVGPGITANNNKQRRSFYEKFRRFSELQWQLVCFSDAHTLSPNHISNARNERVVVKVGTSPPALAKVRRSDSRTQPTVHVYGCLTRYGMCGPYFVVGSLNSKTYQSEVLDHCYLISGPGTVVMNLLYSCRTVPVSMCPVTRKSTCATGTSPFGLKGFGPGILQTSIPSRVSGVVSGPQLHRLE